MAVLSKIKALQTACQRAGIPVPLDAVLRRERALKLPGGGGQPAQQPQQQQAKPKKTKTKGEDKKAGQGGQAKAAPTATFDNAPVSEPVATATGAPSSASPAVVGPRAAKRRPPQTLFEWLHLLSPLLTLVFGAVYALTRAVGPLYITRHVRCAWGVVDYRGLKRVIFTCACLCAPDGACCRRVRAFMLCVGGGRHVNWWPRGIANRLDLNLIMASIRVTTRTPAHETTQVCLAPAPAADGASQPGAAGAGCTAGYA